MPAKLDPSIFKMLGPKVYGCWEDDISNNCKIIKDGAVSSYDVTLTPYVRFIYDNIEDKEVEIIGIKATNQASKSLGCGQTIALEWARRYSGLVVYHYPNVQKSKDEVLGKIIPMVNASPVYHDLLVKNFEGKAKQHSLTYDKIKFRNGGLIQFKGSNASTDFKSYSARLVILDEYAEINRNTEELGDNLVRAHGRTDSFSYTNRKVIAFSTPKFQGEDIEALWNDSQQFQYWAGCTCGESFYLDPLKMDFDKVITEKGNIDLQQTKNEIEKGEIVPYIACPVCKEKYTEADKYHLLNRGKVVQVGGFDKSKKKRTIHVSGMYSYKKWKEIAAAGIDAKLDPIKMLNYMQEYLAIGNTPILANLNRFTIDILQKGNWIKGASGSQGKIATAIDVQENSIYYLTIEKKDSKEIQVRDYGHVYLGSSVFNYASMIEEFSRVGEVLIDVGYKTQELSELLKLYPHVIPVRGIRQLAQKPVAEIVYPQDGYFRKEWHIYQGDSEDLLEQYLANGQIHFPTDVDEELAQHLSNMVLSEKSTKAKWTKAQNHSSCRVDLRDTLRYSLVWLVGGRYGFRWPYAGRGASAEPGSASLPSSTSHTSLKGSGLFGQGFGLKSRLGGSSLKSRLAN